MLLALVAVAAAAMPAQAYQGRVRWTPSTNDAVLGYRVYVRPAYGRYGRPIEAGIPPKESDKNMSWAVGGLTSGRTYCFAVSAYTRDRESWFANEICLGATNPCVIDRCYSPTSCELGTLDEGTSCGPGSCDVCRFGACTTLPPTDLTTSARLSDRSGEVLARVRGRFVPTGRTDPTTSGMVVRFADRGGTMLLETYLPPTAFRGSPTGRRYRLADGNGVNGVRSFNLSVGTQHARVSMLVQGQQFAPLSQYPQLIWTLRFGTDQCMVDPDIVCRGPRCR